MNHQWTCAWPADRAPEAVLALARHAGLARRDVDTTHDFPPAPTSSDAYGDWIEALADRIGLECEPVSLRHDAVETRLGALGPALIRVGEGADAALLALVRRARRGRVEVLAPDGRTVGIDPRKLRAALAAGHATVIGERVDIMLDTVGAAGRSRRATRDAVVGASLGPVQLTELGWILRLPPSAALGRRLAREGLLWRGTGLLGAHVLQYALLVAAWALVGHGALRGRVEQGWLVAWALVLLTSVLVRTMGRWWEAKVAIELGAEVEQRLLHGALHLDPQMLRREGAGRLLSRVLESEAIGGPVVASALLGVGAVIELLAATAVLSLGAGGWAHVVALVACVAVSAVAARRYFHAARAAAASRLQLTHTAVEQIVGNRTRLAQQPPAHWHAAEDRQLDRHHGLAARADWWQAALTTASARGWQIAALAVLAPAVVSLDVESGGIALSIALGGIIMASRALTGIASSVHTLASATLAWQQARPLLDAATREPASASGAGGGRRRPATHGAEIIDAEGLVFRYRERGRPVLRGCGLKIHSGDRIVLQGPSGSGKSTLAALLTGLRTPEAGLLLLRGLDRPTWGAQGWRRHATYVPQFHDNHVLTGKLAFNLLMGRHWPATADDLELAREVCRELGLGPLLERMPAGLQQVVGEQGWQLSHGERSRVFIARALLQNAELVVLDESLAALDPDNLDRVAQCVLSRASTLAVVAHP